MKPLDDIEQFLIDNEVTYSKISDGFMLNEDRDRTYQIRCVDSTKHYISYPKYNIKGISKSFFYDKSIEAENNNSFICWVKDFEWNDDRKREVLKSYFLHAVGKTRNRVYARDCVVKEVQTKEARTFESQHCFYGKRGASLNLGLYLKKDKLGMPKGTLIMIYTFGHNFFGMDNSVEVLRVGTLRFHQVVGGSSKLMKHFINNYPVLKVGKKYLNVDKIKFYSDYDHNIGMSMTALDFKFVNYSKGGFMNYWVHEGVTKSRMPTRHKWVMEQMQKGNCLAVPNAGVKTFVYDIQREPEVYDNFRKDNDIGGMGEW